MTGTDFADAVRDLRARGRVPLDVARRGPVPLDRLFKAANVSHAALPGLTLGGVGEFLLRERYVSGPHVVAELLDSPQPLAGLLYRLGDDALAFVNADDILPRRRFTAAHELGHAVLHKDRMGRLLVDTDVTEIGDDEAGMEREANRFAAELLMPEEVIRARAAEFCGEYGTAGCPRLVLAYRLASELLVSREAMRYRLKTLGVGDDD